jgi:hypothetical protein
MWAMPTHNYNFFRGVEAISTGIAALTERNSDKLSLLRM